MTSGRTGRTAVFDLDGTLIDSDEALAAPFAALGVDPSAVPWGLPLPQACADVGISVEDYLGAYDATASIAFDGVDDLLAGLTRWAICSNKHPDSGRDELRRLGWRPETASFNDGHVPKSLRPVLDQLGLPAQQILFIGDTHHDLACADEVGCAFALAGWNRRADRSIATTVLEHPAEVLALLE